VNALRATGVTAETVDRADFDIDELGPGLAQCLTELRHRRGFVLLRGFPIEQLDESAVELAYVGLGLQLGQPVSQDAAGTLLGHVRDQAIPRTSPAIRRYTTNERQDFDTDGADIIGLLCLQRARHGGESRLTSLAAIYKEILARDPQALEVLYAPRCWDRNDKQSKAKGETPYFALPVPSDIAGHPRFFYIGWYIRDAQRHADVLRLTSEQLAAMDLVDEIADNSAFHVEMDFQPGDIQLLNNASILHAREACEDDPDPSRRRHLPWLCLAAHDFTAVDNTLRTAIPALDSN
jgi:hypothetical protein